MRHLLLVHGPVIPPGTAIRLPATPGWAVMEARKGRLASLLRLDSLDLEGPLPGHVVELPTLLASGIAVPGATNQPYDAPCSCQAWGVLCFMPQDERRPMVGGHSIAAALR